MDKFINQLIDQFITKLIIQFITKLIIQFINQSIDQSINHFICRENSFYSSNYEEKVEYSEQVYIIREAAKGLYF